MNRAADGLRRHGGLLSRRQEPRGSGAVGGDSAGHGAVSAENHGSDGALWPGISGRTAGAWGSVLFFAGKSEGRGDLSGGWHSGVCACGAAVDDGAGEGRRAALPGPVALVAGSGKQYLPAVCADCAAGGVRVRGACDGSRGGRTDSAGEEDDAPADERAVQAPGRRPARLSGGAGLRRRGASV